MTAECHARPHSDLLETWPRPREKVWAALFFVGLAYLTIVGPLDLEAAEATAAAVLEVEGAQAPVFGVVDPFAGAERDAPFRITSPLPCWPPTEQWVWMWGDGRTPYESQLDRRLARQCVNADLRWAHHVP